MRPCRFREKLAISDLISSRSVSLDANPTARASHRDENGRGQIAGRVEHGREEVRNGVDGDQNPDAFNRQANRQEHRRQHQKGASRHPGAANARKIAAKAIVKYADGSQFEL